MDHRTFELAEAARARAVIGTRGALARIAAYEAAAAKAAAAKAAAAKAAAEAALRVKLEALRDKFA